MEQWKKVAWSDEWRFRQDGWPGACVLLEMARGCSVGRRNISESSVMLWAMFCWETLDPGIHVDVTLTRTTWLKIVADHIRLFMALVFPDSSGLFQQDNAPASVQGVNVDSKFPRSQSNWASMRCTGWTNLIHGGSPCNVQDLQDMLLPALLLPDTTGHVQRSCWVHTVMHQSCFGSTRGTYTILGKWF